MRVLLRENQMNDIMEIIYAGYEESVTIDDSKTEKSGLVFQDMEFNYWLIPDISLNDCNYLCNKLLIDGYADLSMYEDYFYASNLN